MVAGPRVGRHPDTAHLSGGSAGREPSVRRLRHYQIQLPVHAAGKPDRPAYRSELARVVPGERTPEVSGVAGYRRASLHLHRQDQRPNAVLRQSVDQEGGDRVPGSVGRIRRGIQFSGFAQLGLDVAGGFRNGSEFRWQRVGVGRQHRSPLRDAVAGRIELRPGSNVLEQHVALYNRDDVRHRFYWWSNAGVEVWDDSHIYYPMRFSASHGFTQIDTWPVNSAGLDLSVVANHT